MSYTVGVPKIKFMSWRSDSAGPQRLRPHGWANMPAFDAIRSDRLAPIYRKLVSLNSDSSCDFCVQSAEVYAIKGQTFFLRGCIAPTTRTFQYARPAVDIVAPLVSAAAPLDRDARIDLELPIGRFLNEAYARLLPSYTPILCPPDVPFLQAPLYPDPTFPLHVEQYKRLFEDIAAAPQSMVFPLLPLEIENRDDCGAAARDNSYNEYTTIANALLTVGNNTFEQQCNVVTFAKAGGSSVEVYAPREGEWFHGVASAEACPLLTAKFVAGDAGEDCGRTVTFVCSPNGVLTVTNCTTAAADISIDDNVQWAAFLAERPAITSALADCLGLTCDGDAGLEAHYDDDRLICGCMITPPPSVACIETAFKGRATMKTTTKSTTATICYEAIELQESKPVHPVHVVIQRKGGVVIHSRGRKARAAMQEVHALLAAALAGVSPVKQLAEEQPSPTLRLKVYKSRAQRDEEARTKRKKKRHKAHEEHWQLMEEERFKFNKC
jgi:hypothetical protein